MDVAVVAYSDDAEARLGVVDGRMRMSGVMLRPLIARGVAADEAKAHDLVDKAHQACFVANSVVTAANIEPRFAFAETSVAKGGQRHAAHVLNCRADLHARGGGG
ncbi:MAG TPA: hypothetical protein VIK60_07700 [Vicinamibacterales bacterium]